MMLRLILTINDGIVKVDGLIWALGSQTGSAISEADGNDLASAFGTILSGVQPILMCFWRHLEFGFSSRQVNVLLEIRISRSVFWQNVQFGTNPNLGLTLK